MTECLSNDNMGEMYSEAYRHTCEVTSVVRMYRETLQKLGAEKAKQRIQSFLLQVEKHRGSEAATRLREEALARLRLAKMDKPKR
jgi:hypothetical protein